jgi:phage terminase small subunit
MSPSETQAVLKHIEEQLATEALSPVVQQALQDLLNLVEHLVADKQAALAEVQRLRQQLEDKKKAKTTASQTDGQANTNHSSEQPRRNRQPPATRPADDRRTFKDLPVHEEIECPVDPQQLPPDAQRCDDERVIIQNIRIEPRNICFCRHVYYSAAEQQYYRGPLPAGFGPGDFGPELQALILALKYCGNMSEPKIREFLENFDVQISSGSLSNILTNTAEAFAEEVRELVLAGLDSTCYQQTDDTAARVAGQFWHTHILCNPFYTAYFTHPHKDRLTVLAVLQLQSPSSLRFRFNAWTRELLERWEAPQKWRDRVAALGDDVEFESAALQELLDSWFGEGAGGAARDDLEQAAAIAYYRQQTAVPVIQTLVCDDAAQFKWLTEYLALCWIHEGRHYARLTPVVPQHAALLKAFGEQFWDYYAALQRYREHPTAAEATRLRAQFDELFSRRTGYEALDERIAKTATKKDELLTVLSQPSVPLHNNASELGARVSARRRDVSLHSRSEGGAHAMDIFTTVVQTCKKLGVNAYAYLRDRLSRRWAMPSLADLIRAASRGPPGVWPSAATARV